MKTLVDEISHEDLKDRVIAEMEAESTAYVVCQSLGIDSANYASAT